jgi:tetratricopeptide (TPR) repeat protein
MMKKDYRNSLRKFQAYDSLSSFSLNHMLRLGYLYSVTGNKEKGKDCFNEQIVISRENIRLNRWYANQFKEAYYDLAGLYFFTGDREEGFKYMEEFGKQPFVPSWLIEQMKTDPLFDGVRDTEEFKTIISRFEERIENEKSRVRQMLRDEGYWKEIGS